MAAARESPLKFIYFFCVNAFSMNIINQKNHSQTQAAA